MPDARCPMRPACWPAGLLLVPQHGPWPMAPGVAHGAGLLLSVPEHGPWPMAPGVIHGARPAGLALAPGVPDGAGLLAWWPGAPA